MSYGHNQYQYADIRLSQQHPSYNGSESTQKTEEPSSALIVAQQKAAQKSVVRKTCLIAIGILVSLLGMIFVFLSYICIFHNCRISHRSVISTAPLGSVLTISQVTSHVAPLSVPIIMGFFSYLLSVRWLNSSMSGGPDRPSPTQLGLLMAMCSGAGLASLFSSVKYVVRKPQNGHKVIDPPILRQSMICLGSLLAITYLTAAADSWLHASSTGIIIPSKTAYKSATSPSFGREINSTTCQIASQTDNGAAVPLAAASCGLLNDGAHQLNASSIAEGIRVVHNASTINQMVLTDDETVIVIPLTIPSNITYSARTVGIKSQCATITKPCLQPKTFPDGSLDYGSDAGLNIDCTKAGIKYNVTTQSGLCALDSRGNCISWLNISSNPFNAGEVVTSVSYVDPDTNYSTFLNNTGWFFHGESGAWNIVLCNLTVLDVTYAYQSSRYITQSSSPKSLADTRAIMSAGFITSDGTSVVSTVVEGSGSTANPSYESVYSWELSRQMLGRAAYIYGSANVVNIESEVDVNGSKLQLVPLVIFIAALVIFSCQILYISMRVVIATWSADYVELTALHLCDPLTTVQRLYGHPDPTLTWETNSSKKFGSEIEGDRLRVGPVQLTNDPSQGSIFMVTKG